MQRKLIPFLAAVLFMASAFAWDFYSRKSFNDQFLANQISKNLHQEIVSLQKEAAKLNQDSVVFKWSSLNYSFYLIEDGKVVAWSRNDFSIATVDLVGDYELKLLQAPRMDLLLYRFSKGSRSLVGVIPLRVGYEIVNRYLSTTWNKKVFPFQGVKILSATDSDGVAVCPNKHECLFKIKMPDGIFITNEISSVGLVISVLLFFIAVFIVVRDLHRRKSYFLAFIALSGSMAAVRIAMVRFLLPSRWIYSEFFDPKYFASSSFNASVGDFFLNALIVTVSFAYLFKVYSKLHVIKNGYRKNAFVKVLISALLLLASFFAFLFPHLFVESIFHDSAISIDITAGVAFDGLRIVAFSALALGCLSSFFFVHVLVRWTKLLLKSNLQFLISMSLAALLFVGYFLFSELNYWISLFIGSVYFSILYFSNYFKSLSHIGSRIFSYLLVTLIVYGAQASLGIWRFAEEKEVSSMFRSAINLISRDVLGEYLLNETTKKIASDKFILSNMASPLSAKDSVRQKVRQFHFDSYFDRYEVKVKLFHADGTSADGLDDFATSIKAFQNEANRTIYDGIYFIHSEAPETVKRYLAVIPLMRNSAALGYVVLDLSLKQTIPQQVYSELLVDNRFVQTFRNKDYSYAFFTKDKLMGSIGGFNFDRDFDKEQLKDLSLYSRGIKSDGYWFAGAEDETGRQAVVASEGYPIFFVFANFSFLFIVGVVLIFLLLITFLISQARKKLILNYSTRIQLYVYLSFIVPLVVVSTIALRMISQSDDIQLEKEIRDKGIQITESISDILDKRDTSSFQELQTKLAEISQASSVDANVYAPSGKLLGSSQPTIFNSQLVMPLPNREAWEKIINGKFNIVSARGSIGSLDYYSLFFAIKTSGKNSVDGILELPFRKSDSESTKVSVLNNILVTFVIVFIAFSFFAFSAIDKLTFPLRFIAKKLKTISLGENQPIEWKANDEIGQMVKEYNQMLNNLEQNKIDLARSQKESAWREIAQQVAHEIKNPLTPMKLTLQQMEQSAVNNVLDQERTKKSIQTMLTQVDVLNGIAGSFSAFAKMPSPVLAKVDVATLLSRTVALFENQTNAVVEFEQPIASLFVLGDDQLLGRIFSNIILNALQSGADGKPVRLSITVKVEDNWCLISFKDSGSGIASELRDKIFLPHFTTKNTGSGLGLAIAKQGIEQMGGAIWFETASGQGTTFFVKLKSAFSNQ